MINKVVLNVKTSTFQDSLCMRVRRDVFDCVFAGLYFFGFNVRDFDGKFILKCHYHLHSVQAVQTQVIREVGLGIDGNGAVNLVEIFDNIYHSLGNLALIERSRRREKASTDVRERMMAGRKVR